MKTKNSVSACVPHRYDVIDESFPNDWFCVILSEYFFFYFGHKNISESYRHFRTHGGSMSLEVTFSIELQRVFL